MDSVDSDDDETFVAIGTPLEIPDEDEPRKKPIQLKDMAVHDAQGRPRFHGAFTGGFSAGYFNTVGSKEGFTPSTFVSSRSQKVEKGEQQRPEDYMDDDDFGEHGIAPRKLVTGGQFTSEERKRRRFDEAKAATEDSAIPATQDLVDIVIPERISVGVRLLRKMGWKEGQGLGPRISRKQRKQKGGKMYGCAPPPSSSDEDELDDDSFLRDITYAPRDVAHILLSAKSNTHGLGYRGLDPQAALPASHVNLFGPPPITKTGRKGIRGQAFGVGALEDEDDDIYTTDHMSNYDMSMGAETDNNFGWTAPKSRGEQMTPVGYIGKVLDGFSLSTTPLVQKKDFPPPQLPRHYRPVHVIRQTVETGYAATDNSRAFKKPGEQLIEETWSTAGSASQNAGKTKYGDAMSRSMALGEKPFIGSVFDLIPKADKAKMISSKTADVPVSAPVDVTTYIQTNEVSRPTPSQPQYANSPLCVPPLMASMAPPPTASIPLHSTLGMASPPASGMAPPPVSSIAPPPTAGIASIGAGFKPFAKDPVKQERYEKYLELERQGHTDAYMSMAWPGQTEWERGREREEFTQAARLYRPLAGMMAMRFTSGQHQHDEATVKVKVEESVDKSDAQKAAEMKMYGKLTRDILEWHPDRLVCKRFNIPDPYPGSSIVGLATVKRDKFSVFNFLSVANMPTPTDELRALPPSASMPAETPDSSPKETEPGCRADKELNKSKSMKSIFSHLMDTDQKCKQSKKAEVKHVSFTVKSVNQGRPKEYKSIFTHLEDKDDNRKPTDVSMETDSSVIDTGQPVLTQTEVPADKKPSSSTVLETSKQTTVKPNDTQSAKPPTDLFRAIFRNTDSEESSSSEDEENGDTSMAAPVASTGPALASTGPALASNGPSAEPTGQLSDVKMESISVDDSQKTDIDIRSHEASSRLPGNNVEIPSLEQRLSPGHMSSGSEEEYGPALPPPTSIQPASLHGAGRSVVDTVIKDPTKESSRKHRHKHKEKHKHKSKKDKKEKSKKHRHKSKQRKEKRRPRRGSSESSPATTDKDTDSDRDPVPSDHDLLQKFKAIKPGQQLSATDF